MKVVINASIEHSMFFFQGFKAKPCFFPLVNLQYKSVLVLGIFEPLVALGHALRNVDIQEKEGEEEKEPTMKTYRFFFFFFKNQPPFWERQLPSRLIFLTGFKTATCYVLRQETAEAEASKTLGVLGPHNHGRSALFLATLDWSLFTTKM